jgi:hypothetical protein
MSTDSRTEQAARPRMFGQRAYTLPDSVRTNIPRQHYDGAPGLWAYARGLLIETCYAMPWTPLALFVGVEPDNDDSTTAVVLTIIAKDESTVYNNNIVTVVWRQDHDLGGRGNGAWQLTINGAVRRHPGSTHVRPSPPILAGIIRDAVNG